MILWSSCYTNIASGSDSKAYIYIQTQPIPQKNTIYEKNQMSLSDVGQVIDLPRKAMLGESKNVVTK